MIFNIIFKKSYKQLNQKVIFCNFTYHKSAHVIEHPKIENQNNLIEGLQYIENYVSDQEAQQLQQIINKNEWVREIARRQQHYGIVYYHTRHDLPNIQPQKAEMIDKSLNLQDFQFIIDRLIQDGIFDADYPPNQCLVNEYKENQTISPHVEDKIAFGPIIAGLSLLQPTYFQLKQQNKQHNIYLDKNSLYVLKGEARNEWKHGIKPQRVFRYNNKIHVKNEKYLRLSLTFRHVLQEGTKKPLEGISNFERIKLLKEENQQNFEKSIF